MPKTFLITGGAGFIGSAVVRELINNTDHTVVNIDKLTYAGNLESLESVANNPRYTFIQTDICNAGDMSKALAEHRPDIIMHLAAESHVDRSIDGPAAFMETNIIGTYTLLEATRAYWKDLQETNPEKAENFRFHHISTDEVYGDLPHPNSFPSPPAGEHLSFPSPLAGEGPGERGREPEERGQQALPLFTETTPYAPSSPYSASKASSDHLVRAWQRTYGLPTLITNCSNNYGPYHFPEKLIPLVILNALAGKPLPVYGDGSQIRDWLYVDDHARALILVAQQGKIADTYNIGGHNEKQNLEVVQTICDTLQDLVPKETQYRDQITFVQDRPGHDLRYAIDASKIEQELGWKPEETFETGLRKTVQWYLNNEQWWKRVQDGSYQGERLGISE